MKVSAGSVVAYLLWAASVAMFGVGWALDSAPLRVLAIMVCIAGATATVRMFFVRQTHLVREAFELGRDAAGPWPRGTDDGDDGPTPMIRRR